MKTIVAVLIAFSATSGCTTRVIEFGGAKYVSKRFGVTEQFGKIEVSQGTNRFVVEGVKSDLVTGIQVGAETALKIAKEAAK